MENEKLILKMYLSGDSVTTISNQLNTGRRTIYRILEKNKITLRIRNNYACSICSKSCEKNICPSCNTNLRRYRIKKLSIDYLGGKCNRCGWSGDYSGFDFHHIDRSKKSHETSATTLATKSWEEIKLELDKCELLCALCHRLEHSGYNDDRFIKAVEKYKGILTG